MLSPLGKATRESKVAVLPGQVRIVCMCMRRIPPHWLLVTNSGRQSWAALRKPLDWKRGPRTLLAGWKSGKERSNFARSGVMGVVG